MDNISIKGYNKNGLIRLYIYLYICNKKNFKKGYQLEEGMEGV